MAFITRFPLYQMLLQQKLYKIFKANYKDKKDETQNSCTMELKNFGYGAISSYSHDNIYLQEVMKVFFTANVGIHCHIGPNLPHDHSKNKGIS